jgi:rhodanese-related sulfurtransferase
VSAIPHPFILQHKGLVVLILILFFTLSARSQGDSLSNPRQLDPAEFLSRMTLADNKIVIDVRTDDEYNEMHIEGAKWIENKAELEKYLGKFDREQPVFIYCQYGFRSATASKFIAEMGYLHVYSMRTGFEGWLNANFQVSKKIILK